MSSSSIYVMHVMCVPTRFGCIGPGALAKECSVSGHIKRQLFPDMMEFAYEGYWQSDDGVLTCDYVAQVAGDPRLRYPSLSGEYVWIRPIEQDEIFDATDSLLVLSPGEVVELTSDFSIEVFSGKHGEEVGDAEAELQTAAFELLLSELSRDYEACYGESAPDHLSEAIVDVLRNRDLLHATKADMVSFSGEIIQLFSRVRGGRTSSERDRWH